MKRAPEMASIFFIWGLFESSKSARRKNNHVCIFILFSTKGHDSAYVDSIIKLELYDMVDLKNVHSNAPTESRNYFHGWFMP